MMRPIRLAAAALVLVQPLSAAADGRLAEADAVTASGVSTESGVLAEAGDLVVADGVARSVGALARTGAGYFTVANAGEADDRLTAASSDAAQRVELHAHRLEDGIARMVVVDDGIVVPAGGSVVLEPGGMHVMFMGLTDAWAADAGVVVTLEFERAGAVEVTLPRAGIAAGHDHEHDDGNAHGNAHGDGNAHHGH